MQRVKHFLLSFTLMLFCIGALTSAAFAAESTTVTGNSSSGYTVTFTDKSTWTSNPNTTTSTFFDTILLQLTAADSAKLTTDNLKKVVFNNCTNLTSLRHISNWSTHTFDIEFNGCDFKATTTFNNIDNLNSGHSVKIDNCVSFGTYRSSSGNTYYYQHSLSYRGNVSISNITFSSMVYLNLRGGVSVKNLQTTYLPPVTNPLLGNGLFYLHIQNDNNSVDGITAPNARNHDIIKQYSSGQLSIQGSNNNISNIDIPLRTFSASTSNSVDGVNVPCKNNHFYSVTVAGTGALILTPDNTGWAFDQCSFNVDFTVGHGGAVPDFIYTNGYMGYAQDNMVNYGGSQHTVSLNALNLDLTGTKFNGVKLPITTSLVKNDTVSDLETGNYPAATVLSGYANKFENLNGNFNIDLSNCRNQYPEISNCNFGPHSSITVYSGNVHDNIFKHNSASSSSFRVVTNTVTVGKVEYNAKIKDNEFCNLAIPSNVSVTDCTVYNQLTCTSSGKYTLDLGELNPASIIGPRVSSYFPGIFQYIKWYTAQYETHYVVSQTYQYMLAQIFSPTAWINDGSQKSDIQTVYATNLLINAPEVEISNYKNLRIQCAFISLSDTTIKNIEEINPQSYSYNDYINNTLYFGVLGKLTIANCKFYGKLSYTTDEDWGYSCAKTLQFFANSYDVSHIDTVKPYAAQQASRGKTQYLSIQFNSFITPSQGGNDIDYTFIYSDYCGPNSSFNLQLKYTFEKPIFTEESVGNAVFHDITAEDVRIDLYGLFDSVRLENCNLLPSAGRIDTQTNVHTGTFVLEGLHLNTFTKDGAKLISCNIQGLARDEISSRYDYADWDPGVNLIDTICYGQIYGTHADDVRTLLAVRGTNVKIDSGALVGIKFGEQRGPNYVSPNVGTWGPEVLAYWCMEGINVAIGEPVLIKEQSTPYFSENHSFNSYDYLRNYYRAAKLIGGFTNPSLNFSNGDGNITIDWGTFPGLDLDLFRLLALIAALHHNIAVYIFQPFMEEQL